MAPPVEPPTTITLRVKVPPGHVPGGADEFTLGSDIAVADKIGRIRDRIQEAIPSRPTPERQRILYGGRALVDNDQTVADALNIRRDPTQTEYVIHLLIKGDGASTAPVPHRTGMGTPARSASPATAARPPSVPPAPAPQTAQNAQPQNPQHIQRMQQELLHQQQLHIHNQMQQHAQMFHPPHGMFPQMPFQIPPNAGQMPFLPFAQPNGMPWQQFPAQAQQQPVQANGQQPSGEAQNTSGQQPNSQPQQGQPTSQLNNGQTTIQLPPRMTTHQTPQGHDVQVRISQTLRIPHALQAQQRHAGSPQLPGNPPPQGNGNVRSALDQARENVAEIQRLANELRSSDTTTETQQDQIRNLEERIRSINNYIDPFGLGGNRATSNPPAPNAQIPPGVRLPPLMPQPNWQQRAHQIRQTQRPSPNTSSDVTCYMMSSPTGPYALLYSPQHGAYTGHIPAQAALQPTPTTAQPGSGIAANIAQDQANPQAAQPQGQAGQQVQAQAQAQVQAAQQDPMGPLGPILGHLWLLLRVLIFSYFLLGANMGWRRPLALFAIGMGFWMIRMGLLGDGGALRRWWDGIMNDGRAQPAQQQQQPQGQQDQNQQQGVQQGQAPAANARPGQMPTPEQLAQRLLDEDARARDQARDQRLQWLRERVRPVERAIALLVASLWPGVGEAYVRAREAEDRRRAEEEIAARRREEEERQKKEEEEKQKSEEGAQGDEKSSAPADIEAAAGSANQPNHENAADVEKASGAA